MDELNRLKQRQGTHLLQIVQDNLTLEARRQETLGRVKKKSTRVKMEQQFIKERKRDRQRIERLQADQRIIIQRKAEDLLGHLRSPAEEPLEPTMAFSSSSGRNPLSSATAASRQPKVLRPVIPPKTLSHVKNGNVEFNYASETPSQHSNYLRPVTVQETESYRNLVRRSQPRHMVEPLSERALSIHSSKSERSLLRKKDRLLAKLSQVKQEQQVLGCSTIRSSVSSFHSSQFDGSPRSDKTYQYIPFSETQHAPVSK